MSPSVRAHSVGGMRTTRVAAALAVAVLAGCGGGGSSKPDTPEQAVKNTILDWTFKQDKCPYMTDKFLEAQAFIGETRAARCEYLKKTFSPPRYSKDAVKFRKVQVSGTTATAVIGDDFSNVEATYKLVKTGDRWMIDEAD
jgi:hypothetical protein